MSGDNTHTSANKVWGYRGIIANNAIENLEHLIPMSRRMKKLK